MLHLINSLDRVSSFSAGQTNMNSVTKPTHLEYAGTVPTPSSATPMILRPDCVKQLQVKHDYTKQDLLVTINKQLKTHHSFNVLISLFIHLLSPDDQGVTQLFMVDPLSYFSFQPVLHNWCNKGHGMCYPVCGMMHIKEPLLLIRKSSPCGSSRFPLSLSEWSFTICVTPYNRK